MPVYRLKQKSFLCLFFFLDKVRKKEQSLNKVTLHLHYLSKFFYEYYSAILSTVMDSLAVSSLAGEILPGAQGHLS